MTAKSVNRRVYFLRTDLVIMYTIKILARGVSDSPFLEIPEKSLLMLGLQQILH